MGISPQPSPEYKERAEALIEQQARVAGTANSGRQILPSGRRHIAFYLFLHPALPSEELRSKKLRGVEAGKEHWLGSKSAPRGPF